MKPKLQLHGVTPEGQDADPTQIGRGPKKPLPRRFQTLDGLIEAHEEHVRAWWKEHGSDPESEHRPMIVAVCKNGDIVPVVAVLAFDEAMKDMFADHMRVQFQQWKVERYVFISEAWLAEVDPKSDPGFDKLMPSERADRKEVMMIVAADRKKTKGRTLEMVRDWQTGAVVDLKPDPRADEIAANMSGRFAALLRPIPNPLDDEATSERIALLGVALLLRGADPSRIDDIERMREWGKQLWADVQAAEAAIKAAITNAQMDAACDQLNAAFKATQPFFVTLAKGYRERDRQDGKAGLFEDLPLDDLDEGETKQ